MSDSTQRAETKPTLSILTAVADPSIPYIDETWQSIIDLELPDGWTFEWCVQSDAADADLTRHAWANDPRVSLGRSDRPGGAAAARNNALLRAQGTFLLPVDADDLVEPGMLTTLAGAFSDPLVGWAGGGWLELPVEESRRMRFIPKDPGIKEPGWLGEEITKQGTTPFQMNSILYRRAALVGTGGWPAFSEWEDTLLAVTVSSSWRGYVDSAVVGRYRRHAGQTINGARFKDPELRKTMIRYICEVSAAQISPGS
jgi:glycosyltransferase involved in cell wall biosynthesis